MSNKQSINYKEHTIKYVYMDLKILVHPIVKKIVDLSKKKDIGKMTLRGIGEHCGAEDSPQQVKHHLNQLVKMGVFDYIAGKYIKHF